MLTFRQTSRLLGSKWRQEASRIMLIHGLNGTGDMCASQHIDACKADYVLKCVERELLANPGNTLAQDLKRHLQNAMM